MLILRVLKTLCHTENVTQTTLKLEKFWKCSINSLFRWKTAYTEGAGEECLMADTQQHKKIGRADFCISTALTDREITHVGIQQ